MLFGNPHTHNPHTQLSFLKQTTQSPLSHTPMFPSNLQKKKECILTNITHDGDTIQDKSQKCMHITPMSQHMTDYFFQAMQKKEAQFGLQKLLAQQYSAQPFLCWHN